jgi:hypothetical protein
MEPYTKELITWAKHLDVVNLRKRIGYLPGYIVLRLFKELSEDDKEDARINVGFSQDKKRFYLKLMSRGVKLSMVGDGKSRHARTFCLHSIRKQFGESIIGQYRLLEGAGFDDDKILAFERIDDCD